MMEFKNCKDISALRSLWKEAFEDSDEFLDMFFSTAYSYERCLATFIDDELAGALYIFDCELNGKKIAYIYAVATAKKHRGKGVCQALMHYTHDYLKKNGYTAAILVPGSRELFAFYEKSGYKTCGFLEEFECKKRKGNLKPEEITAKEYMSLRHKFLPENSVVNINTEFLNGQLSFFKGEDFIFAARKQDNGFFVAELLGCLEKAPEIVGYFGCEKGIFRSYGNSKPFLMGYTLTEEPLPDNIYYPFAFD